MSGKGKLVSYFVSPFSKISNPEHTSQFTLVKNLDSNKVNDLLKNKTIPVTLYDILLPFRDTDEKFELHGDLSKTINTKNYNVNLAKLSDKNLMFDFAKEMYFDERFQGEKSASVKSLLRLLKSTAIMEGSLKASNTRWLSSDPNELCDRFNLILLEKQAGKNSDIIHEETIAIVEKLLEYKCIFTKQQRFIQLKGLN